MQPGLLVTRRTRDTSLPHFRIDSKKKKWSKGKVKDKANNAVMVDQPT